MCGKLRNMTAIYLRQDSRFLLLYRIGSRVIDNSYTGTGGGHFEPSELNDAKACVLRELNEETGLTKNDISNLTLRYITVRMINGEIRLNYYFFADYKGTKEKIISNEGRLEWVETKEIMQLPMPYTASKVMEHFLKEGQKTEHLYVGVASGSGVEFVVLKDFDNK